MISGCCSHVVKLERRTMISKILMFVACASLLSTSQAEAQLFRRFRVPPQPQRYVPVYPQNGYQGRLTAVQSRQPVYIGRADGSVVRYFPNNRVQQPVQTQNFPQQQRIVSSPSLPRQVASSNTRPIQGQLIAVQPTPAPTTVVPIVVSALKGTNQGQAATSIFPATSMPEASLAITAEKPASAIPVNDNITNPVPQGLSLSLADDAVVPASADVPVNSMPEKSQDFSVLEFIE